ncbi:serine hydrolase [Streptomyces sp. CB02923]|nr:serine hydrolase [Streptomyces sp. CB02923]
MVPHEGSGGPGKHGAEQFGALLPETNRALLRRLAIGQADGRAPSLTGAVIRGGEVAWAGSCGATADATDGGVTDGSAADGSSAGGVDVQYRIGSITKTFVAVLVLRLRDEGLLTLEDPLDKHVPGSATPEVTIAQLLSHSSGLSAEARGPWWERTPGTLRQGPGDLFEGDPRRLPAGRGFHYSNPGYALLGSLIEHLRDGQPWGEVLRREVLEPLGMNRTTLQPQAPHADGWAVHPWADVLLPEPAQDTGLMSPAGQLWSTAEDLGRWAGFLARGDDRVLSATTLSEMRTPAVPPEGAEWSAGFGLGLQLARWNGRLLFGHSGSMPGFLASLWIDAAEDVAGIALANCTSGPAISAIAVDLAGIVAEREPRIPEPWRPLAGPLDEDLLALTGPWYWGANPHVLRLGADRALELSLMSGPGGRSSRFRAEPDGTWTGLDGYFTGERLRIVRTEDGSVSHLDVGTFVFTRGPYEPAEPVPGGVDQGGWRGR